MLPHQGKAARVGVKRARAFPRRSDAFPIPRLLLKLVKLHHATARLLRRIRAAVDTYFIYRRKLGASRSTSLRFALKRLALSVPTVHLGASH